ncbi:MAG TPA: hypothetical protein VM532_12090 [Burkholderiales bacterium]|nr:hypothetical protein [Burkholderiales bacterium]
MRYLLTLLCLLVATASSWARDLPADGVAGDLLAIEYPFVRLADKQFRLAPGARIFDVSSRIVMPNTIAVPAKSMYKLDVRGDVQEIWLLTPEEVVIVASRKKLQ